MKLCIYDYELSLVLWFRGYFLLSFFFGWIEL